MGCLCRAGRVTQEDTGYKHNFMLSSKDGTSLAIISLTFLILRQIMQMTA